MMDADAWLDGFEIDEDKKEQFLALPEDMQQMIILKGPLQGCRDPTAVLVSRLNALPPPPEVALGPHGGMQGKVKSYSVFKGFGFIYPEADGEPDIFLHVRAMVDGSIPSAGDMLTFDLEPAETSVEGQMKAVNARGGTGYPLTDAQKGKGKDGDKGGSKGGKVSGGGSGKEGPYGKGAPSKGPDRSRSNYVDALAPEGQYTGRVKSYSVFKGFGFIFPGSDDEPDIFLHVRQIVDGSTPRQGDTLTFDLEPADTDVPNQMKAMHVRGGTGYPLTEEQKGETKGKGKGHDPGDGGKGKHGKGYHDAARSDPYGKGYGKDPYGQDPYGPAKGYGKDPYGSDPYGGKGWDGGKGYDAGKGWDGGKGWHDPYAGKGYDAGKGYHAGKGYDAGKGWDDGKGWGGGKSYDAGKGWDSGKGWHDPYAEKGYDAGKGWGGGEGW